MGRVAEGWKLVCRKGIYGIRWTNEPGKFPRRPEVSLRTTDPVEAARLAPSVYAEQVSGSKDDGTESTNHRVSATTRLKGLIAEWLDDVQIRLGRGTGDTYLIHANHWLKHMKTLGDLRPAMIHKYQNARLESVLAVTLELETSTLRRFCKWLKTMEYIRRLPEIPKIEDGVVGTKYHKRRREKPTEVLTPEQMDAVIDSMAPWSKRKVKGKLFPVKARFEFARETGLRPITIDGLIGRDLTVSGLSIRNENDKNRWGRVVPLTERARLALESVLPDDPDELIFGHHEWDVIFYKHAVEVLGPELADKMAPYDLKHGLVTEMFDLGIAETGIQFLTGTKSAIRRYSHPTRRAAEEAIWGRSGDGARKASRKKAKKAGR